MISRIKPSEIAEVVPQRWLTNIYGLLIIVVVVITSGFSIAPVEIKNSKALKQSTISNYSFSFTPPVKVLEDPTNSLTLRQTQSRIKSLKWVESHNINYGFSDSTHWLKTVLHNQLETPTDIFVELGYPMLDDITVFGIDSRTGEMLGTFIAGDQLPYKYRAIQHPNFLFPFFLEKGQSIDIYIKVKSSSSIQMPIKVWSENQLFSKIKKNAIYSASIFGAILIMAFYNLFLSFILRNASYFYFAITLSTYSLVQGDITGYNYELIWPNSPHWNDISLCVLSAASIVSFSLFARSFLLLQQKAPKLDNILLAIVILNLCLSLSSFFAPYEIIVKLCAISGFFSPLIAFFISLYLTSKKMVDAKYFVTAFSSFIIFSCTFVLSKFGILESNLFIENTIHIGVLLSVTLLSFSLADRINAETKQKEIAQAQSITNLNQYRYIYENSLEGLFQATLHGDLLSFNKAFYRIVNINNPTKNFKFSNFFIENRNDIPVWEKLWQKNAIQGLEVQCKKPNGAIFWASIDAQKLKDKDNNTILDGSIVDITEKKESQKKLSFLASHDSLTGLYNRYEFERFVNKSIDIARKYKQQNVLLYIDLDQFKIVNDTCGHNAGDELLKQVSQLLQSVISNEDILARVGGDEFAIVLNGCQIKDAKIVASRILRSLEEYRFSHNEKFFTVGASIGAVHIDLDTRDYQDIIKLADAACYAAKEGGRNRIVVHNTGDIVSDRLNEMQLVSSLKEALEKDSFVLFKQYIKPLQGNRKGLHYEVLTKMKLDGKLLDPGYFIPAMERFNQMKHVDFWIIEKYFSWLADHPEHMSHLNLACVNISAQTLEDNAFEEFLISKFKQHAIPPEKICFEIVESSAIINLTNTQKFIKKMRAHGVKFALDDFGTGFSSYSHLKSLGIDYLKIDGSFIRDIMKDDVSMVMVKSMTDIAHSMGLKVVAEFVENVETYNKITELGIDFGQGFYFDKPKPIEDNFD